MTGESQHVGVVVGMRKVIYLVNGAPGWLTGEERKNRRTGKTEASVDFGHGPVWTPAELIEPAPERESRETE